MSGAEHILGNVSFGPARSLWEEQPSLRELYEQACAGLVRAECEVEELRAEVALLQEQARILARERDEARGAISAVLAEKWLLDPQCAEDQALVNRLKEEAAK